MRRISRPGVVQKISDMHLFDNGWNALRDQIFANQKRLGAIPADAKLTPWPDDLLQNWDKTSDEERSSLSIRPRSMPPISPIPIMRSAA